MGGSFSHRIGITAAIIITLLSILSVVLADYDSGFNPNVQNYTRKITLKQGSLRGIVVKTRLRGGYVPVEQYLGIPYAAPPVGQLRFMPPQASPYWKGDKYADSFGSVCPQELPDSMDMEPNRKEYFNRLRREYLMNEAEDCLYLNIYVPYQGERLTEKYPIMVFIHGESYEWNTGNAYDGSVLAAFGKVIVVTLNYRLGVLGFLKTGFLTDSKTNFGLIDQVAALIWIKDNIREFGGDPEQITMFGHGTGAACISFLTLSPIVIPDNKPLFKRAILMGGTALSDWALATKSRDVTYGIVHSLNCPTEDEALKACLRKKRLREIKDAAKASSLPYITRFGPVVDSSVIPNEPEKLMTNYIDLFHRFELMYGLTEVESANILNPIYLLHGMLDKELDKELTDYINVRCAFQSVECKIHTLYKYWEGTGPYGDLRPTNETKARDVLLDILSDARSAAPMAQMGKYHSILNAQSYFYVFGHTTASKNSILNKSVHGDELPYIFGVPLDSSNSHFRGRYTEDEKKLSEMIMTLWVNFAYNGNPNVLPIHMNGKVSPIWPEFDTTDESYLYLAIPYSIRRRYRDAEIKYWNEEIPSIESTRIIPENRPPFIPDAPPKPHPTRSPPADSNHRPPFLDYTTHVPSSTESNYEVNTNGMTATIKPPQAAQNTMNILIVIGGLFLLFNVIMFSYMYYKCRLKQRRNDHLKRNIEDHMDVLNIRTEKVAKISPVGNGCSLMKMITSKSTRSDDTYEAVNTHESTSSKRKLTRQISASTIDAHTKVRDWIAQEIVNKYSPKLLRKGRRQNSSDSKQTKSSKKKKEKKSEETANNKIQLEDDYKVTGSNSTLGQSPTRPVSPVQGEKEHAKPSMIPVHKSKKADKISVGIDATPAGRGSSVLRQQPIELTKSLDYSSFDSIPNATDGPIRRVNTLDDILSLNPAGVPSQKSSTSINVTLIPPDESTIIRIDHGHSKSDLFNNNPNGSTGRKLKTFDPDINVTSRDEPEFMIPLTPEESLRTIKRRNFPKVLPDLPGESIQSNAHKRRSMPAPNYLFLPIPENPSLSQPNSPTGKNIGRCPPMPPPRISSNLVKNGHTPLMQSAPAIAQEPPLPEEPEVACNNLYIGPLIPSRENRKITLKPLESYKINNQPIYDNLNPKNIESSDNTTTTKRIEPKVIIKPTISRQISDPTKLKGPRVVVNDILMAPLKHDFEVNRDFKNEVVQSGIPMLARQNSKKGQYLSPSCSNKESSSDSTPSEGSDTGTVVKRA